MAKLCRVHWALLVLSQKSQGDLLSLVCGLAFPVLALQAGRGSGQLRTAHPTVIHQQTHSSLVLYWSMQPPLRVQNSTYLVPAPSPSGAFGKVDNGYVSHPLCTPSSFKLLFT